MKKIIKSLVAGLMATGCLLTYGETKSAGGHLPPPVLEEVFVREMKFAVASDIKTYLETFVTASQKDGPKSAATVSDTDRGIIRGKVLIVADDRTNKLIVITAPSNIKFFEKIISFFDVETTSEMEVKMIRLKYAEAKDVESMLNGLIGASPSSQSKNKVKIIADKRTNSIVVKATKADMAFIMRVIEDMDIKPNQVLFETAIIQVNLDDDLQTGADWVVHVRQKFSDDHKLNIAAITQAAKTDGRAKCVATSTVLMVDNKMATIEMSEMQSDIDGFAMKLTPRSGPTGTVALKTEMTFNVQRTILRPGRTHVTCKRTSEMILGNAQTVMLEGPKKERSELLVFITPHVY